MSEIQCVVVTPEKTEIDVRADSVTVPLFDGELGILRGHSALVGRLGFGPLRIRNDGQVASYFIDGGIVQVNSDVVSVLTDKVLPAEAVTKDFAEEAMREARAMPIDSPEQKAARQKAIDRARALARIAQ